jgi:hypothetical protein
MGIKLANRAIFRYLNEKADAANWGNPSCRNSPAQSIVLLWYQRLFVPEHLAHEAVL